MTAAECKEVDWRRKYNHSTQMCKASIPWVSFRGVSVHAKVINTATMNVSLIVKKHMKLKHQ
jgi:hypothetical protein